MRWIIAFFGFVILSHSSFGQDKKIDQLEILYDQGYYKKVVRKSNKLMADPEFDYSALPAYYKSLSLFRMSDDPRWYKRHKTAVKEAIDHYELFAEHSKFDHYLNAHYYEIASLKSYLEKLEAKFKEKGFHEDAALLFDFRMKRMISIKGKPDTHSQPNIAGNDNLSKGQRDKIVDYAKTFIGVKYVWAGSDPSGFDCSGFTSYVMKKYGIPIPRTASGQMEDAKKVKTGAAQKGDLVFFGSGAKITHVGMVVSIKGDELAMIHASTSKGVIVTNIETSTYWAPKLKGAGTYL